MPALRAVIEREAADAKTDPSLLPGFCALRLNQGVSDVSEALLLEAGTWAAIEADSEPAGPFALGVDLGQSAAMSACAAFWPESGCLRAFAAFPNKPSLAERGLSDGVGGLYKAMHGRGELIVSGERVVDVGELLAEARRRWGVPSVIVADRFREAELRQELERADFPLTGLCPRGMGFVDGAADVRDFRRACVGGMVKPAVSLLLRSAVGEARVTGDAAGNWKLAKSGQGGRRIKARDDAAAASILAVAEGYRRSRDVPPSGGVSVVGA